MQEILTDTGNPSSNGIGPQEATDRIEALLGPEDDDQAVARDSVAEPAGELPAKSASDSETPDEGTGEDDAKPEDGEAEADKPEDADAPDGEAEEYFFAVPLDGKDVELPISQIIAGYQGQKATTQKMMEAAEISKAAKAEQESAQQERAQYAQMLGQLEGIIQQWMPQEPDWDGMLQSGDMENYWAARAQWDERARKLDAVSAEQTRVRELNRIENEQRMNAYVAQERDKVIAKLPAWKDPKVFDAEWAKLRKYAKDVSGYSDEELERPHNHRAIVDTWKAMKYDEMMAKANQPKPVAQKFKPVLRPGVAQTPTAFKGSVITKAKQRLARTGNVNDGISIIEQLLS